MPFFQSFKWLLLAIFFVASIGLFSRLRRKKRLAARASSPEPSCLLFDRLAKEMYVYAKERGVIYEENIETHQGEHTLVRTTTDPFGKKRYVEHQSWQDGRMRYMICRYEDGSHIPSASAIREQPASSYDRDVHHNIIHDIRSRGAKISFRDGSRLNPQLRVPKNIIERRV